MVIYKFDMPFISGIINPITGEEIGATGNTPNKKGNIGIVCWLPLKVTSHECVTLYVL